MAKILCLLTGASYWTLKDGHRHLREEAVVESADEVRHPISLKEVCLEDYDAVYYPRGHGPMEDLSDDPDSGSLLRTALASGKSTRHRLPRPGRSPRHPCRRRQHALRELPCDGFCNEDEAGDGFAGKPTYAGGKS